MNGSELSFDRPQASYGQAGEFGARWFFVTSAWSDVSPSNQSCDARVATWSPDSLEWSPGDIPATIWDPSRAAEPGIGTLIRAIWNPVSRHWEIDTGEELVFFRLVSNKLLATQPVTCEILAFNGVAWLPTARFLDLYDSYYNVPGFFTGVALIDRGWARLRKRADDPELQLDQYELIWMSGPSHLLEFTLTANRTAPGTSAEAVNATINQYYLYGHDQLAPTSIWFPATKFPYAKTGAKGMAAYDDRNRRYVAWQCDQLCVTAHGALTTDMCASDQTYYVSGFTAASEWPLNQKPPVDEQHGGVPVLNFYNHRGLAGDIVALMFWEDIESYVVIDVQKHPFTIGGELFDDGTNLYHDIVASVVERCSAVTTKFIDSVTCGSGGSG